MRRSWSFLLLLAPFVCFAHTAKIASAKAVVRANGSFELRVRFDVMAFLLELPPNEVADGPMNALLDGPKAALDSQLADARQRFVHDLKIQDADFDVIEFPNAASVHRIADSRMPPRLPVMMTATISGHLDKGARTISVRFPDTLGTVVLTTEMPYREPVSEPVEANAFSTALTLPTAEEIETASASFAANTRAREVKQPHTRVPAQTPLKSPEPASAPISVKKVAVVKPELVVQKTTLNPIPQFPFDKLSVTALSHNGRESVREERSLAWYIVLPRYVKMGFNHIIPQGLDHILFILGLFFLSTRLKDLVKQITAFTIAHSVTLALALYGIVRLPSSIVEPIIALSIAFVAIENLFATEMKSWRLYVVFTFGLVHGLGFASALQDAGLQKGDFLTALIGFNGGVELGQLSVVAVALLVFGMLRKSERYRSLVAVPASVMIALVALTWTVQRLV